MRCNPLARVICAAGPGWHTGLVSVAETGPGTPAPATDRLVVVGASAGGIEALSVVVSELPPTFAAPIVVAQHLHPDHPSSLAEIIRRRTDLRVLEIRDEMPLEPGTVYIVPPDRHVAVTDHAIRLDAHSPGRPKPSVDRLLETASGIFKERLIAVILSGTGSDGAAGAQYVAAAGGTVIAQDPETASFPSMPRSLSPQTVDAVTRVEAIGPLLERLISGETTVKDEDATLDRFLAQLRDRAGIDFTDYKRPTIVRRLERRIAATRSGGLADYRRYLLRHPEEVHRLTSSLLIKVTDFFRDPELFDEIRTTVLPALIEAAGERRELRLWSAGCATGEEAYSLAILVAEVLGRELPQWSVRIFATDADPEAIAFARRGVYPKTSVGSVSEVQLARHFRRTDGEYEVAPYIRAMTVFGEHDLGQRAPFPRIDLVLCRNVLIYFTQELQRRALHLFAFSLRDGGYLALGKSESVNPQPTTFVIENAGLRIFRRAGERTLIPTRAIREVPHPETAPRRRGRRPSPPDAALTLLEPGDRSKADRAESALLRIPVGVAIVNEAYDTEFLNTAARSLLGIHGSAIGQDFIHQARSLPTNLLRDAVDRALAGEAVATTFDVTSETPIGAPQSIELTFAPLAFDPGSPDRTVLITVQDRSTEHAQALDRDADLARLGAERERLDAQLIRLQSTNRELLRGNEELATANIELRTTNQELLVYNEELQAASEEVETLNEELQATNEELETLNEELQATVEELNTANEDLAARSRGPGAGREEPAPDDGADGGRTARLTIVHADGEDPSPG
jgi:two-component system, chemotaxis family, CheB/CheR fusion protein